MGIAQANLSQPSIPDCLINPLGARVIVIGAGPVGIRFANQLRKTRTKPFQIVCFNGERYAPYDRIKLSQLLTRQIDYPDVFWCDSDEPEFRDKTNTSFQLVNRLVRDINVEEKYLVDNDGLAYPFDFLVIATGSTPHIPQVPGANLTGVYTFRNMRDVEHLLARTHRSRHTVVVGGGLLGLEAAKGLLQKNTQVTLVHQADRLMNRQLDEHTALLLQQHVTRTGIKVLVNEGLVAVSGCERVEGITTRSGQQLECDTVVLCTGIKPNTDLALKAALKINRGIIVDKNLQTSARNIFAIGECSEFNGQVHGLVAPGLEQASILADHLTGGSAQYFGSSPYAKLKVFDIEVSSVGDIAELGKRPKLKMLQYRPKSNKRKTVNVNGVVEQQGRSLALAGGKLIGACGVGEWPELQRLRESYTQQRSFFPWQIWLFKRTGKLWFFPASANTHQWPATAVVCQCNQINRARIDNVIAAGATNVVAIGKVCGAGTVCGSCQPLLDGFLQQHSLSGENGVDEQQPSSNLKPLALFSLVALALFTLLIFLPGLSTPSSVQQWSPATLLENKLFKQISGFTLLGVTLVGLMLSLRKRLRWQFLGQYNHWRTVHTLAGVIALVILLVHTGAHLGEQLNRWLMLNYLTVAGIGALLGIAIAISQNSAIRDRFRQLSFWFHVVAVWPLPILVCVHVVSSYYF